MAEVRLPSTLQPLFAGLPRKLELDAPTVADALAQLDERWPGVRDRLVEGGELRRHIHVYVDGSRAGLGSELGPGCRVDVIAAISGG